MFERVWGGNNLGRAFGKRLPEGKIIGESWELSDRPEAQSIVARGRFAGRTIRSLLEEFPGDILGALGPLERFPLLVKYVDAGEPLSVQVHPDDSGAKAYNDSGKSECWVVVRAEPGAKIVRGLKPGVTRGEYAVAVAEHRVESLLNSFDAHTGDVIALPAGMVHAIGKGLIVAEIQQNSDLTFRIYDYNRLGLDGQPRKLHTDEALEAIRFDALGTEFHGDMRRDKVWPEALRFDEGLKLEELLDGKYFDLKRATVEAGAKWKLSRKANTPSVLMLLSGSGTVDLQDVRAGDTGLLPASLVNCDIAAKERMELLLSTPRNVT